MKKKLKLLIILLTIVFGAFNFANRTLIPAVSATYVEGPININTVWTLSDSPFVVSNNVTINPSATLTIEPGVEVKFGGPFFLIVNGRLLATGTTDKKIRFTSNNLTPERGDWGTIEFNGTLSSSLTNCIIEYGREGIIVNSGTLNLKNSVVTSSFENGIVMNGGDAIIENNNMANNTANGIYIAGGNQVNITNNIIEANGNGVNIAASLTTGLDIKQNTISSNTESGIFVALDLYDKITILNNIVSENYYGFYVATSASTSITRNSILDNAVGIYYSDGVDHEAHFNNIYGNNLGMDVSSTANVSATYNYWGHQSGPKHNSLNPYGEGNPVGGDGVNLDFIFFLSAPIDYTNKRPKAKLWADMTLVTPNQQVTFVGADSYDQDENGRVDQYFYDFNDGSSVWTTLSVFEHAYSAVGNYTVSLKVRDDFNSTSDNTDTVNITVRNDVTPLQVAITFSNQTVNYNNQVSVAAHVTDSAAAVAGANVTLFSVKGGSFISGLTNSSGWFTATFTTPNVTEITNVRLIASASKTGYADGSDYEYLKVLPPLMVQMIAENSVVQSESSTQVTAVVTLGYRIPIDNALLVLSSDAGDISPDNIVTNVDGSASFTFNAPQTLTDINVSITATAAKIGYALGIGQTSLSITPKTLAVQIAAEPNVTISERAVNVTVHVAYSYDMSPVSEANVVIQSGDSSNFTATGLTDTNGDVVLLFVAPPAQKALSVNISASASKIGYVDGQNTTTVTVNPGSLKVEFRQIDTFVISGETAAITVYVSCNETPVANTSLSMWSDYGSFSTSTGITDSNGTCTFHFEAPMVSAQLSAVIRVNASKVGYTNGSSETKIELLPKSAETGWSITTILLIVIPIAVVVIVVVLVKLKVISFSTGEKE